MGIEAAEKMTNEAQEWREKRAVNDIFILLLIYFLIFPLIDLFLFVHNLCICLVMLFFILLY